MTFRVLGPLEVVVRGGQPIPLRSGKLRVLLAALLLHAHRTVSIDELAAALWDGDSPAHPRNTIQKYVMRLRSTLQATGCLIQTEPEGYRIELAANQLDLDRFNEQLTLGLEEAQRGALAAASVHLTEALATWRGVPPLSNVVSDTLHRDEVSCLVERYLHALEARTDVDLKLGRHSACVKS